MVFFLGKTHNKFTVITVYLIFFGFICSICSTNAMVLEEDEAIGTTIHAQGKLGRRSKKDLTFKNLSKINAHIQTVKECSMALSRPEAPRASLLQEIQENLLRISWRVEEIPSQDKFRMAPVIPEKSWLLLGHLSTFLNRMDGFSDLKERALILLGNSIIELQEALPVILKILSKDPLSEAEKKSRHVFPSLSQCVSESLDQVFLERIRHSTLPLYRQIEATHELSTFHGGSNNRQAVLRAFEIIGEGAKYITKEKKSAWQAIPWLVPPPQKKEDTGGAKGNLLTTLRNKIHHDRKKVELLLYYEPDLFQGLVKVLLLIDGVVAKVIESGVRTTTVVQQATHPLPDTAVQQTLTTIVSRLMEDEDHHSLSGWEMEALLQSAGDHAKQFYDFLKQPVLSQSEEVFVEAAKKAMSLDKLSVAVDTQLRCAYTKLKGKKLSTQDIEKALKMLSPARDVEEIKKEIWKIILEGSSCSSEDLRNLYLVHLLFNGIGQSEGEKKLEELRARVSCDISLTAIEELVVTEAELSEAYDSITKRMADSHKIRTQLEQLSTLKKNALDEGKLRLLIGLSGDDRKCLLKILNKEPPDIREEDLEPKIQASSEMAHEIQQLLAQEKKFEKPEGMLGKLLHLDKTALKEIWKIVSKPHTQRTFPELERVRSILSTCTQNFKQYKQKHREHTPSNSVRTPEDLEESCQILKKLPALVDPSRPQRQVVNEFLQHFLQILRSPYSTLPKEDFERLVDVLPLPALTNKLKSKYKKKFLSAETKIELEEILALIHSKPPAAYLQEILEREWIREETRVTEKKLREAAEEAEIPWEEVFPFLAQKRQDILTESDVTETIERIKKNQKALDGSSSNKIKFEKIGAFISLLQNLLPDLSEVQQKDLDACLEDIALSYKDAKFDKTLSDRIKSLYCRKTELSMEDLQEVMAGIESAAVLQETQKKSAEVEREALIGGEETSASQKRIETLKEQIQKHETRLRKIGHLKETVHKFFFLSKKEFETLLCKAGVKNIEIKQWQPLYHAIACQEERPLPSIIEELQANIGKLDLVFDALRTEGVEGQNQDLLKMSTASLLEEIGLLMGMLVNRSDYQESTHISTSRRNFYLMEMCRKAMAHYPLAVDDELLEYFVDQLVFDTRGKLKQVSLSLQSKQDIAFHKTRVVSWSEFRHKKTAICALIEGLGFKSDFKIFGKTLGWDISVQGDFNILVEWASQDPQESYSPNLVELEIGLSHVLNCEAKVYTKETFTSRQGSKVSSAHLDTLTQHATQTLEDMIRGMDYVEIFNSDHWASFDMPDGRSFTRSQFLEQKDLRKIFSFFIKRGCLFEEIRAFLEDKDALQRNVREKLLLYSPNAYCQSLNTALEALLNSVYLYQAGISGVYIPWKKEEQEIFYKHFVFSSVSEDSPLIQAKKHIYKQEMIPNIEHVVDSIVHLLQSQKGTILGRLVEPKIFEACSLDYALTQDEITIKRQETSNFREQRLHTTPEIKAIIKQKTSTYLAALNEQLSKLSPPNIRALFLKWLLLDKQIDQILEQFYTENEAQLTFLWQIMDETQQMTFSGIDDLETTVNVNNSRTFFKLKSKQDLSNFPHAEARQKIEDLQKAQKKLQQEIITKRFQDYVQWQERNNVQTLPLMRGNVFVMRPPVGQLFLSRSIEIRLPPIPEETDHQLGRYSTMFMPVRSPSIIQCFLEGQDPKESIFKDLSARYCSIEESSLIFTMVGKDGEHAIKLVDFSSEVEYTFFRQTKQKKDELDKISDQELGSLPEPLKELIQAGRKENVSWPQMTLLGFAGEIKTIFGQVISGYAERRGNVPTMLTENLPKFVGRNMSNVVRIETGSETECKAKFSIDIVDLNDLMQRHGMPQKNQEAYRSQKDRFERDNIIVIEYFDYRRLDTALKSARTRQIQYEKKRDEIKAKLAENQGPLRATHKKELNEKIERYQQALEANQREQRDLTTRLGQDHPYVQRKIVEVLRDFSFLYDLWTHYTQNPNTLDIQAEIHQRRIMLYKKALEEIGPQIR